MQLESLGENCELPPAGSGAEPQPKSNLVHFSIKRWHLVTTILIIFLQSTDQIFWMQLNNKSKLGR